jgi:TIR domain
LRLPAGTGQDEDGIRKILVRAIFISYRRDDAEGEAGRLFHDLVAEFGAEQVFIDVSGIEPGRDFRKVIEKHVASCGVVLTIIGKNWIDAKDEAGRLRLDDPMDFVRLETASALRRDIPVIPVVVHGGRMPQPQQLPEDLQDLAYRNGVELTHARWDSDVQVLIKALRPLVASEEEETDGVKSVSALLDRPPDKVIAPAPIPASKAAPATSKPADESLPVNRSWRWVLVAVAVAMVLAAGAFGGYAYLKTEKSNVMRAGEEYARKQAAEDQVAVTAKAATDQAAKDKQAAQRPGDQATAKGAADQAAKRAPQATLSVQTSSCVSLGSGGYKVNISGVASAPSDQRYYFGASVMSGKVGFFTTVRCPSWGIGQPSDTVLGAAWQFSCAHRPSDPPDTTWTMDYISSGTPPSTAGFAIKDASGNPIDATNIDLSCH